jgi:hypothetical protein
VVPRGQAPAGPSHPPSQDGKSAHFMGRPPRDPSGLRGFEGSAVDALLGVDRGSDAADGVVAADLQRLRDCRGRRCPDRRADELPELSDALLCGEGPGEIPGRAVPGLGASPWSRSAVRRAQRERADELDGDPGRGATAGDRGQGPPGHSWSARHRKAGPTQWPLLVPVIGPRPVRGVQQGHGCAAESPAGDEPGTADCMQWAHRHVHPLFRPGPRPHRFCSDGPPPLLARTALSPHGRRASATVGCGAT